MFFGHFFFWGGRGWKDMFFVAFFFRGGGWRKRVDGIDCWFYMLQPKRWLICYIWEVSQAVFRLLDKSSHAQKTYIYNSELLKPPQAISFNYCLTETTTRGDMICFGCIMYIIAYYNYSDYVSHHMTESSRAWVMVFPGLIHLHLFSQPVTGFHQKWFLLWRLEMDPETRNNLRKTTPVKKDS